MGKRGQNKKKAKGTEKTLMKKEIKLAAKHKKMIERIGERDIEEIVHSLEQEQVRLGSVTEVICEAPTPRSYFSFVAHPSEEELILFGGELYNGKKVTVYNDMYFYMVKTQQWKQLNAPAGPTPRSGHQMVPVPTADGGELWLFGGEHASPSQLQFYHYRDLWVFSLSERRWEKVEASNVPSARSGHRMVLSNRQLILFGGFYDNYHKYEYFNDVHLFDMDKRQWQSINPDGFMKPAPRSGGCMAAYPDGRILIWGGYTKRTLHKFIDSGHTFTDMYEIVSEPNASEVSGMIYHWRPVKPQGHQLLSLNSVSYAAGPNNEVYCFGGVVDVDEDDDDLNGKFTQELVALDLATQTWRLCEITERDIQAGGDVAKTSDGSGKAANVSSFLAMPNLFRKQSHLAPTPRMHSGLCILNNTLYLYGGVFEEMDRVYTYNDFYSLDLASMDAWKVLIPNNANVHEWLENEVDDDDDKAAATTTDDDSDDDEEDEQELMDTN